MVKILLGSLVCRIPTADSKVTDGIDDAWAASVLDDSHFLLYLLWWNRSMCLAFVDAP